MQLTPALVTVCAFTLLSAAACAADASAPAGVVVEAEHFKPLDDGWRVVMNGQGNYMVDIIGFQHISGERLLCAHARAVDAKAVATVQVPEDGDYRVWSRFETPTQTQERFRIEIRQQGKLIGSAVMGKKDAPKYWFGGKDPVGQYDASWGSEGLAAQSFDVQGLRAGAAEIMLVAPAQPEPAANRNVDFVFLTRDMTNAHRTNPRNRLYPILDAALPCIPPRYYVRLTSPVTGTVRMSYSWNRANWSAIETNAAVTAGQPSAWIPLRNQDVCHFTTLYIAGQGGVGRELRVELAGSPDGTPLFRTIDWEDPSADVLQVGLPAYPGRYPDERIVTVEEQYRNILAYLKAHDPKVGREPTRPTSWGGYMPVWQRGRVADAAAAAAAPRGLESRDAHGLQR